MIYHLDFDLSEAITNLESARATSTPMRAVSVTIHNGEEASCDSKLCIDLAQDKILTLPQHPENLVALLTDAPLAVAALQIILDGFLTMAREGEELKTLIAPVFPKSTFPHAHDQGNHHDGSLTHPMLEHMDLEPLSDLYCALLRVCKPHADALKHLDLKPILPHCPNILDGVYYGVLAWDQGAILHPTLLNNAYRTMDNTTNEENRVQQGREAALSLAFENDEDWLNAWQRADAFQGRLCRDMHTVLTLHPGKACPEWVRSDMSRVLEREAMKQIFAQKILKLDALKTKSDLITIIEQSAKNDVTPALQQAANELLNNDGNYSGTLHHFAAQAEARQS